MLELAILGAVVALGVTGAPWTLAMLGCLVLTHEAFRERYGADDWLLGPDWPPDLHVAWSVNLAANGALIACAYAAGRGLVGN